VSTGPLLHADLYRIVDPREVDELGLFDLSPAIVLVEWPERDPELMSRDATVVTLSVPPDGKGRIAEIAR
jgi:tRNA A37 threonylcarbamoyladenosine biosynthesis protein TsaE